jgi:hypothetical protein
VGCRSHVSYEGLHVSKCTVTVYNHLHKCPWFWDTSGS